MATESPRSGMDPAKTESHSAQHGSPGTGPAKPSPPKGPDRGTPDHETASPGNPAQCDSRRSNVPAPAKTAKTAGPSPGTHAPRPTTTQQQRQRRSTTHAPAKTVGPSRKTHAAAKTGGHNKGTAKTAGPARPASRTPAGTPAGVSTVSSYILAVAKYNTHSDAGSFVHSARNGAAVSDYRQGAQFYYGGVPTN